MKQTSALQSRIRRTIAVNLQQRVADGQGAKYCTSCASALDDAVTDGRLIRSCPRCGQIAYRIPTLVAVTIVRSIVHPSHIWLIRRAVDPFIGQWALPGGYVEFDEHPEEAARRECAEELACDVEIDGLVSVHHARYDDEGVVVLCFSGFVTGGDPHIGEEVLEVRAFPLRSRPALAFNTHEEALHAWSRARGVGESSLRLSGGR